MDQTEHIFMLHGRALLTFKSLVKLLDVKGFNQKLVCEANNTGQQKNSFLNLS